MRNISCLCKDYIIVNDLSEEIICYVDNVNYNIKLSKIAPIPGKEEVAINALKNFILNINTTSEDIFRGPISITNWLVDII